MPYAHSTIQGIWVAPVICVALLAQCTAAGQSDSVGQITDVINVESRLNNTVASGGEAIHPGAVLATDRTGVMDFRLTSVGLACRLSRSAEARVLESQQTPLHYTNGTAVCLVARDPGDTLTLKVGRDTLKVEQSAFRIKFHTDGQSIAVVRGAITLQPAPPSSDEATGQPGASPIILRPGGEVDCSRTTGCEQGPTDLVKWPSEQAAAAELFTQELQHFAKEHGTAGPIPSTPPSTTPAPSEHATTSDGVEEESEIADPDQTTDGDGDETSDDGDEQPDDTSDEGEEPIAPGSD